MAVLDRKRRRPPLATCGTCGRSWNGYSTCHCHSCHATFTGWGAFDAHRSHGTCRVPESLVRKDGNPTLMLVERSTGPVWGRWEPEERRNSGWWKEVDEV
jgi:hypothetical protein